MILLHVPSLFYIKNILIFLLVLPIVSQQKFSTVQTKGTNCTVHDISWKTTTTKEVGSKAHFTSFFSDTTLHSFLILPFIFCLVFVP